MSYSKEQRSKYQRAYNLYYPEQQKEEEDWLTDWLSIYPLTNKC